MICDTTNCLESHQIFSEHKCDAKHSKAVMRNYWILTVKKTFCLWLKDLNTRIYSILEFLSGDIFNILMKL